jgi:hypothetical protein
MVEVRTIGVLAVFLTWLPCALSANLGEPLAAAKLRGPRYKAVYGAVAPIFQVDAKGGVVMECWAAPPEMWSKTQAMGLGAALVPVKLSKIEPKSRGRDGSAELFEWPDGTTMVLRSFRDKYLSVEVRAATFTGNRC